VILLARQIAKMLHRCWRWQPAAKLSSSRQHTAKRWCRNSS